MAYKKSAPAPSDVDGTGTDSHIKKNFIGKNSLDRYNIIVFHRNGRIYRHIV